MERRGHYDFVVFGQPWLMARSLRAVIRQDPSVLQCTAHKDVMGWRLHIEAPDPLEVLQRALQCIKSSIIAAALVEKTHNVLQDASRH